MTDIGKSEGKSEAIKGYVRIVILYEQNYFPCGFHIVVIYHVPKPSSFCPPPFPSSQKNHNYQTNMIFQKHISSFSFLSFWKNVKFYADFYWIVRLYIVNMNFVFFQDVWEFRGTRSQTSLTGYQLLSTGFQSVAPSSRVRTKNPLIIKWFPNPPGSENQRMVI